MAVILENFLVMVLSVVVLLGGCYMLLLLLNVWLKFKGGSREQDGLTDLLIEAQREALTGASVAAEDPDEASAASGNHQNLNVTP